MENNVEPIAPSFLDLVPPSVAFLVEYFQQRHYKFTEHDDRIFVVWNDYTVIASVTIGGFITFAAQQHRLLPPDHHLTLVEGCNRWNAQEIGPKAFAELTVNDPGMGAEGTDVVDLNRSIGVRVGLAFSLPLDVGVTRLQFHRLFTWYHACAQRFFDRAQQLAVA
jgi:hypothetical protein